MREERESGLVFVHYFWILTRVPPLETHSRDTGLFLEDQSCIFFSGKCSAEIEVFLFSNSMSR